MCGRFALFTPGETLAAIFDLAETPVLRARYNIAPSQESPVIRVRDGGRHLDHLRWGLVPAWARSPHEGPAPINARAESAADKPMFRSALRHRRCVIPADGFYEWQTQPGGVKRPMLVRRVDGRPLALAGLWERWEGDQGPLETFTILTTPPNDLLRPIHDRMPAVVRDGDIAAWLDPSEERAERLTALLAPAPDDLLRVVEVSRRVNSPRNDDAACLDPAEDHGLFGEV